MMIDSGLQLLSIFQLQLIATNSIRPFHSWHSLELFLVAMSQLLYQTPTSSEGPVEIGTEALRQLRTVLACADIMCEFSMRKSEILICIFRPPSCLLYPCSAQSSLLTSLLILPRGTRLGLFGR